jgi:hypothetical protein
MSWPGPGVTGAGAGPPATGPSGGRRWWAAAPDPTLPPISARRAYTEVLFVYLAFFLVGIMAAVLLLANRSQDLPNTGSWGIYITNAAAQITQIGLAVAVVLLLAARRSVTPAALGLRIPRLPDGRVAVSRSIRIAAWSFLAIIVGDAINVALQTGHLPTNHTNAPELIFGVVDAIQAGVVEELVVLAFVVVTLRQAGRSWWEVTAVALVLRGAYHIYYGPGVVGILVWAALFYWLYLRFRQVVPLMICHALWDSVAFLSQATVVVAEVGELLIVGLWITALILWLVERNSTPAVVGPAAAWSYGTGQVHGGPAYGRGPASGPWYGPAATAPTPAVPHAPAVVPAPTAVAPPAPAPAPVYGPPPGWHPDPAGHNRWRWWDGYRWTDHVSSHASGPL